MKKKFLVLKDQDSKQIQMWLNQYNTNNAGSVVVESPLSHTVEGWVIVISFMELAGKDNA